MNNQHLLRSLLSGFTSAVYNYARERGVEYIAPATTHRRPDLTEGLLRITRNEGIRRAVRNLPERQRTVVIIQ